MYILFNSTTLATLVGFTLSELKMGVAAKTSGLQLPACIAARMLFVRLAGFALLWRYLSKRSEIQQSTAEIFKYPHRQHKSRYGVFIHTYSAMIQHKNIARRLLT